MYPESCMERNVRMKKFKHFVPQNCKESIFITVGCSVVHVVDPFSGIESLCWALLGTSASLYSGLSWLKQGAPIRVTQHAQLSFGSCSLRTKSTFVVLPDFYCIYVLHDTNTLCSTCLHLKHLFATDNWLPHLTFSFVADSFLIEHES